jgi:uncharacterized protein (DUF2236 family)
MGTSSAAARSSRPTDLTSATTRPRRGDLLGRDPEQRRRLHRKVDGVGAVLAGGANVALQLSWRPVARGVLESPVRSGSVFVHPLKRTRTTLTYLAVAMYGDEDTRAAYRRAVNSSHRHVRSAPGAEVPYNAFDRGLQLWVASCLYFGARDMVVRMHGAVDAEQEQDLLDMGRRFATTLQVTDEQWHESVEAFEEYWAAGLAQARREGMDDQTVRMLRDLLEARLLPFPFRGLLGPVLRFYNVGFLPPEVRELLDLEWSGTADLWHATSLRVLGTALTPLPDALRAFPFNLLLADLAVRRRLGRPLV